MLRRTGFKSKAPARAERDPDRVRPTPTPSAAFRAPVPVADMGIPMSKGPAAKPGKHSPNAEERAWMDFIVAHGCVACRIDGVTPRPTAVHHILRGGVRMGHLFTLPLCDPGHHQGGDAIGLTSRHPWKARFEKRYGTEMELLARLQALRPQ